MSPHTRSFRARSGCRAALIVAAGLGLAASDAPAQSAGPTAMPATVAAAPARQPGAAPALPLTLDEAIRRGLEANVSALVAEASVLRAEGDALRGRSELLPHVAARGAVTRQQINLAAFGFSAPGLPDLVGPFTVVDGRVRLTQAILDLQALDTARSDDRALEAARLARTDQRQLVAQLVTTMYVQARAAEARALTAAAALETSRSQHRLAVDLKEAGLIPRVDVLRAELELAASEERQIAAEADAARARLSLARAIGLSPVTDRITLADTLSFTPAPPRAPESAVAEAIASRPDLMAADARLAAAELRVAAAGARRLPTVHLDADGGVQGQTVGSSLPVFAVQAGVTVPLFTGLDTKGRIVQAAADRDRVRAQRDDLRRQVEFEVQTALLDIASAERRVETAQRATRLAAEQRTQAEDRFRAGVAGNIDVVQAQEAFVRASDTYVGAVAAHTLAKAALARALGVADTGLRAFITGTTP